MSDTPKVGDKVRYIVEGTVTAIGGYLTRIEQGNFAGGVSVNHDGDHGRIEILERADDPAKDPVGTVRRFGVPETPIVWVKTDRDEWQRMPRQGIRSTWRDAAMSGSKAIGPAPGTPAAEAAEKPAEPEYEYYRGRVTDMVYRVAAGRYEWFAGQWEGGEDVHEADDIMSDDGRYFTPLDGKPSDVD